ncbi:interleukin-1 receptor type 1-like [Centroberyx gerrardi]
MGLSPALAGFLLVLRLFGGSSALQGNCTDYRLQFERVFSVPGDAVMLNSTLVSPDVFDFTAEPYNISWYDPRTGRELSDRPGRFLLWGETLWVLKVQLEDAGEYVAILRTASRCYRQATMLVVDEPLAGECSRPRKAIQMLTNGVTDALSCPLKDYLRKLDNYSVPFSLKWYKGCEPIEDGSGKFTYWANGKLKLDGVTPLDNGSYTCMLNFTLGGVTGSVSETIDAGVKEDYVLTPQVHEPSNEIIKAEMGSSFSKRCQVFVPCVGRPSVSIHWVTRDDFIFGGPSDRVYAEAQRSRRQEGPNKGVWLESLLRFSELKEEDFFINYTCQVYSARGSPHGKFTLVPADPNFMLPIGLVFGGVAVLFTVSVVFYYLFKIDIVLWFRRAFPVFYTNTDSDGKLYDAYVAYPRQFGAGSSGETETFVLHMLPQVLEKSCGYKLFIAGRDCLPGQAIVDSVEENMQASRRLLLLYTASTFSNTRHNSNSSNNNNNNIPKGSGDSGNSNNSKRNSSDGGGSESFDGGAPEAGQQFECETAMHRVLLEGSLKVVLVEMEPVSPAQLALFPESVRHLRKKQGAVCWWKSQSSRRGRSCTRKSEDEETGGPSLSPSSRFWKEMRYYMPVRGKRAVYPERTALLNL